MAPVFSVLVNLTLVATSLATVVAQGGYTRPTTNGGARTMTGNGARTTPTARDTRTNVIVTMREGTADVLNRVNAQKFPSRGHRVRQVQGDLETHARKSQQTVFDVLNKSGATFQRSETYWLTNQVYVHGATADLITKLKKLPNVVDVSPDEIHPLVVPVLETASTTTTLTSSEWGVNKINAPQVWATGNTGSGITVGVIDTGVRATHEAIVSNFRQSFNWFDPEKKATTPYDATGHGTHVVGIIAGQNGIGVAPGATWIACKGCRSTGCFASDLLSCFQFMLCPTTPNGLTKDCSKAPNIVNNSWGGGQGLTTFNSVINAWRTAGIIPIFAGGNTGPNCGTIQSPGDNPNVITVGAVDMNDNIPSYSARGPTVAGLRKPDIAAPGSLIRSSCWTGDVAYCSKSGTSMATPHVTGAVILYMKANPGATYDQIKNAFQNSAITTLGSTGAVCGTLKDNVFPNNHYGYGRIDAVRALGI